MKLKLLEVQKKDVEKLTIEELDEIISWGRSNSFKVIRSLGADAVTRRALDAMESIYVDFKGAVEHGRLSGMKVGIDFILDLPQRALEEKARRKKE